MTALLIGPEERAAIKAAMQLARANVISLEEVMAIATGVNQDTVRLTLEEKAKTPNRRRTEPERIELPLGYAVCVSYEQQPFGLCIHLSVSLENEAHPEQMPHPLAIKMIAHEFGVGFPPSIGRLWIEEFEPGRFALNMTELLEKSDEH